MRAIMSEAETSQPKRLKLSESEEQADSEQTYSPYYTANLRFILNFVLSKDSVDKNALKEDEICIIEKLKQLEETVQQLFIRLFLRKHQWILVSRIKYPKIASDLKPILAVLVESGFLQDERHLNELPLILDLMPAEDLKLLCKNFKVSYQSSKQRAVEALMRHSSSFKPIFGSKSTGSIILTKAKSQLGSCVRVADGVRQALHKAILLFSLPILAFEDMSEPQSVIYRLLQVNIGSVVFPSYPIVISRPLFQSSEYYDRFYAAYCTEQSLVSAIEQKNNREVESIMKSALEKFHTILGLELKSHLITNNDVCIDLTMDDSPEKDIETAAKSSHKNTSLFKRYSDGSVYTRILSSCVEHLERCRRYEHANELLETLLSQSMYCVSSRGTWWERLALNLDQHLKKYSESVDVIVRAMNDPSVRTSRRLSLVQRAQRLRKHVKTVANNKIRRLPEIDFISASVKEVRAKMHPCRDTGVKSHFIMSEGEDTTSIFLSVESLAISHYKETEGWTHAVHAEGTTFAIVYGLLFWDVVFGAEVPDVFRNTFQAGPLDYFTDQFYANRKELVDSRLHWISSASSEDLLTYVSQVWDKHYGERCVGMSWDLFANKDDMLALLSAMDNKLLNHICSEFARDNRLGRAGLPDLTLWKTSDNTCKFVEVKGPNDKLSQKQILWLDQLIQWGCSVEVCKIKCNLT